MFLAIGSTLASNKEPVAIPKVSPKPQLGTLEDVVARENAYYAEKGKYLQIPKEELPPKFKTIEYKTPKGEYGYQVLWEDSSFYHSKGYGPEADSRTYKYPKPKPFVSSTSTPQ